MPLTSITYGSSADVVEGLLNVLFFDARDALDLTFGLGGFWKGKTPFLRVVGLDLDPTRGLDLVGDFRGTGLPDASYDVCLFDPPYITNPGHSGNSIMAGRFGSFANVHELEDAVRDGATEAWRLCRLGVIVKVQNHTHGGKFVHMTRWVEESIPSPLYDELHCSSNKIEDPKWNSQLSIRHNHATYLVFRKGSQTHSRNRSNTNDPS